MMQGVLGSAHSEVSWGIFPAAAVLLSPQAPTPVQLLIYQQQLLFSGAARVCRQCLSQPGTRRDTWRFRLMPGASRAPGLMGLEEGFSHSSVCLPRRWW